MSKVHMNVSLDEDTAERLKCYAIEKHCTVSAAVTEWIWSKKIREKPFEEKEDAV